MENCISIIGAETARASRSSSAMHCLCSGYCEGTYLPASRTLPPPPPLFAFNLIISICPVKHTVDVVNSRANISLSIRNAIAIVWKSGRG